LVDDWRSGSEFGLTSKFSKPLSFLKIEIFSALRFTMAKIVIIDDEPAMVARKLLACRSPEQ